MRGEPGAPLPLGPPVFSRKIGEAPCVFANFFGGDPCVGGCPPSCRPSSKMPSFMRTTHLRFMSIFSLIFPACFLAGNLCRYYVNQTSNSLGTAAPPSVEGVWIMLCYCVRVWRQIREFRCFCVDFHWGMPMRFWSAQTSKKIACGALKCGRKL